MRYRNLILLLVISFICCVHSMAQTVISYGDWDYTVSTSNLEAGKDITGTHTSSTSQVYLSVAYDDDWVISVKKSDVNWDDTLILQIIRTGDGYTYGSISDGESWKRIKDNDRDFFEGDDYVYFVPLQYRIRKASVIIPADTYETSVIFTVTDD